MSIFNALESRDRNALKEILTYTNTNQLSEGDLSPLMVSDLPQLIRSINRHSTICPSIYLPDYYIISFPMILTNCSSLYHQSLIQSFL